MPIPIQTAPFLQLSANRHRVSTDQGLEQDFNSLDAQREASEAYVKSQAHEGWKQIRNRYDDGGCPAARWTGLRCGSCCPTSRRKEST